MPDASAMSAAPTIPARLPSSAMRTSHPGLMTIDVLVGVLDDAAADHDQLGPEHPVQVREVRVEPFGPLAPRQLLGGPGRVGHPRVGHLAAHLDVSELRVGDEHTVVQERGADARADGYHEHDAAPAPGRPETGLGHPGRVGVVQHGAVAPGRAAETAAACVPIHDSSMCAAVRTVPPTTTAGSVHPIGPVTPTCSTSVATTAATASGVEGSGVTIRIRPVAVPVARSTCAALMPEPPTSTPIE